MSFWSEYTKSELEFISIKNLAKPLGLDREAWRFSRGAKTERHYTKDGNTHVKVVYYYAYPDDGQGADDVREISYYTEKIYLLETDGSIFHEIQVPATLSAKNIKEINRSIRFGRIDFLDATTEQLVIAGNSLATPVDQSTLDALILSDVVHPDYNTPALYETFRQNLIALGTNIEALFLHYHDEIYDYKDRGTTDFYDAVTSEADSAILAILDIDLPPTDAFAQGSSVIEAIKYQLRGELPV